MPRLLELRGAGVQASGERTHPSASLRPRDPAPAIPAPGASHPGEDLPRGPACRALPEPSLSLLPQTSRARSLGLEAQALKKTVISREREVTRAAQAIRATAHAALRKTEPVSQVGVRPLRQGPGGGWGCPRGDLGVGLQGREGQRSFFSSFRCLPPNSREPQSHPGQKEGWTEGRTDRLATPKALSATIIQL